MTHDTWRPGFHIAPPVGWLNDPNGLCQFNGIYHVFHQYSPDWPAPHAARGWGHATSRDLVHWEHHGMVICPDTPDEASGSYSGCAVAVGDGDDRRLRFYYTGNVKEPGDYDYVHAGRRAAQILIESPDGFTLGEKRVLLRNADYPDFCTCHVRDPKVWRDDAGTWWMLLGARDLDDRGLMLVLRSTDGIAWEHAGSVRPDAPFGFMWECPDRVVLDGRVYLSFCPQGMADYAWANSMRDQSGYVLLPNGTDLADSDLVVATADFRRWDYGFDFYAPQTFVDEQGRTILIGWMGVPEAPFDSAPDGLDWCHCLTVPRVLTRLDDGAIAQNPVPELTQLHEADEAIAPVGATVLVGRRHDISITGIDGPFFITLDGALELAFDGTRLSLAFSERASQTVGGGRTVRSCPLDCVADLRLLVDGSAIEVFANGGRITMATRWFPTTDSLVVSLEGACQSVRAWTMGNGMYRTA